MVQHYEMLLPCGGAVIAKHFPGTSPAVRYLARQQNAVPLPQEFTVHRQTSTPKVDTNK